jgi:sorting nexin-1/2
VIKSTATGKHHVYKVKGRDHQGEIDITRRFREFDTLRKVFYSRFLGLYVPPIPEKKTMGKTEGLFVEERQFFLDRFLKEVC